MFSLPVPLDSQVRDEGGHSLTGCAWAGLRPQTISVWPQSSGYWDFVHFYSDQNDTELPGCGISGARIPASSCTVKSNDGQV